MLPPKIIVCSGTRCLLNDSVKLREEIGKILVEKGLDKQVMLFPCGCFGLCQYGPTVAIINDTLGKVVYVNVKMSDVRRIIEEHLMQGKILTDLLPENNINYERLDHKYNIK